MKKTTNENIAEALFEIINGLHGFSYGTNEKWDLELAESKKQWHKQATRYLKRLTLSKNIELSGNQINIQNHDGTKTIYSITIK